MRYPFEVWTVEANAHTVDADGRAAGPALRRLVSRHRLLRRAVTSMQGGTLRMVYVAAGPCTGPLLGDDGRVWRPESLGGGAQGSLDRRLLDVMQAEMGL